MSSGPGGFERYWLLVTVFFCGMTVLVLEVLGSRILGPYFGISLFIWTSLITVTLISLSLGYFIGGLLSDRYRSRRLFYLLILLASFAVLIIPLIQKPVSLAMTSLGPRFGCLTTALILFLSPLTLLGIVAPFSLRLFLTEIGAAGRVSGNLYALSTLGGILGTVTVGFWLIPHLGLNHILFFLAFLLALFPACHFTVRKEWIPALLSLGIMGPSGLLILGGSGSGSGAIRYKSESYYGQVKVLQLEQNRMLMVDGAVQTAYQIDTHRSRAPYTQIIEEALKTYHEVRGETGLKGAVVGLGGGIIPEAEKRAGDRVDIIEIDPRIPKIAETFFEFHPGEFQITLDDARNFFNRNQTKYDYIVMDVFAGESSPFHLLSRECFEEMKTGLSPGGLLVMNTIGLFAGEGSEFIRSIYKTLGSSFPYRSVIAVSGRDNFSNYIMLASEKPLSGLIRASKTLLDGEVYLRDDPGLLLTDDFNPADYLEQNVALAWRLAIWKGTYPDLLLD